MFHDATLKNILANHMAGLENNIKMLDNLSSDIKNMQKVLKEYAVPNQRMDIENTDDALIWDGTSILFESGKDCTRLIETKKEIRLQVKPLLPVFLRLCLKTLGE